MKKDEIDEFIDAGLLGNPLLIQPDEEMRMRALEEIRAIPGHEHDELPGQMHIYIFSQ